MPWMKDNLVLILTAGKGLFSFTMVSRSTPSPHLERPDREPEHWRPTKAGVTNVLINTCTPIHVFMMWCFQSGTTFPYLFYT